MRKFSRAMFIVSCVTGVAGFVRMVTVNEFGDTWFRDLNIGFILFIVGFVGALFFEDVPRSIRIIKEISFACAVVCLVFIDIHFRKAPKSDWAVQAKNRYHTYKNLYKQSIKIYNRAYQK